MLKLRVTWPNAGHPLLPETGAKIDLQVDGAPLTPTVQKKGIREFEIPDGAGKARLEVSFTASFGSVKLTKKLTRPPQSAEVFSALQDFTVVDGGTRLEADMMPGYLQHNPLIDTKSIANINGAMLAQVHTEFVDITPFWEAYWGDYVQTYKDDHKPGTKLFPLGYTGGKPLIWFASVPDACWDPPTTEIPCLVFYRPDFLDYKRIDEANGMFRVARFLLSPIEGSTDPWSSDVFRLQKNNVPWIPLRASFEEALHASGRPLIMLHPIPNYIDFGESVTKKVPELAAAIVRYLWGAGLVSIMSADVRLGRLGLAGYSSGGTALWRALRACFETVREAYSFDCQETAANQALAVSWLASNSSNLLRMTGGIRLGENEAIRRVLEQRGGDLPSRFTATPRDRSAYAHGANPHWDHVVSVLPEHQGQPWSWHQFAVFGSFPGTAAAPHRTFLQQFLEESRF
jgi:hypothetical protein